MNEVSDINGRFAQETLGDDMARDADAFVAHVGDRVRRARESEGMTRRALSERSGVSQRYLAQLEKGDGNISIALLYRVARALGRHVDTLIGVGDEPLAEPQHIEQLYRLANDDQRQRVLQILKEGQSARMRRQRICLIGLRGAGKSTLGKMLGGALEIPFMELNDEIERQSGMPVDEVMALYGQEGYRRLERQALENVVSASDTIVLASAGGVVTEAETFTYLLQHFHTIWLRAAPEEHMERVRLQGDERPMAGNPRAMEDLKSILKDRESLYAKADAMVDTSGKSVGQAGQELVETVKTLPVFEPQAR